MSDVVNRRVLLERTNALVKKSQPTLNDVSEVGDALADVITDLLGASCRVIIKVDAKALQAAIARTEAAERGVQ
jgi:hypothetical protein